MNGDPKDFCNLLQKLSGDREVFFSNLEQRWKLTLFLVRNLCCRDIIQYLTFNAFSSKAMLAWCRAISTWWSISLTINIFHIQYIEKKYPRKLNHLPFSVLDKWSLCWKQKIKHTPLHIHSTLKENKKHTKILIILSWDIRGRDSTIMIESTSCFVRGEVH